MNFLSDDRFLGFQKTLDARHNVLVDRFKVSVTNIIIEHVFYYNCKLFLNACRSLKCSQFSVAYEENLRYIEFTGRSSKTLAGGLRQRNIDSKCIRH